MRFLLAIVFFLFFVPIFCQQKKVDSLLEIVSHNGGDAKTFYALKKLGEISEKEKPELAIRYYRHAIGFPFRTTYGKEFVNVCNSLGELYHSRGLYDSSFLIHRQAIALAQKFNFSKEWAIASQGIGLNFMRLSQNDSARQYYNQVLTIAIQLKDFSLQASAHNNLGNVLLEEAKYPESLEEFIKGANLFEQSKDKNGLGKALVNIGNMENILGHFDKALDYTQRAQKIFEELDIQPSLAYCHRLRGRIYRKLKSLDKALREYEVALKIYTKTGDLKNSSETYQNIGNIYFDQGNYKNALTEFERSLKISRAISNNSQMAYDYSGIGIAWTELKNFDKAILYFDSSIIKAREIKNRYLIIDAYHALSSIYADKGNYKKALDFHRQFSELTDSLTSEENRQTTEELEAKYQNTKKQAEIELLQKDQLVKNISLKQSRTLQTALITAFVMLIIIGFLIFNRNKMVHQANRQMDIERMRNQIARDLHDDMGSTLSSINLISQVALKEDASSAQTKYFKRIVDQSAKMMESMSDMVWSINPDNDTVQKTVIKMKEFSAEILEPKNIGYQFQVDNKLNEISLDVAKRKNLFLLFKESINNAAKYSESDFVTITISQTANDLHLSIRDNGNGFDISNPPNGNGLKNMKERALEVGATLKLESSIGLGTNLELVMPLT
jgi:signal transduction histidine kinase